MTSVKRSMAATDPNPAIWPRTAVRDVHGALHIGGVSVLDLAERFGTPAYLFDEAEFRFRCMEMLNYFHGFDVHYAGKAFLCKAISRLAAEAGLGMDACTSGELAVLRAAEFPAGRVVLHGNNKSSHELAEALEYGVGRVVIDSFEEIECLARLLQERPGRPKVLIRITLGIESDANLHNATGHEDQKFGFSVAGGAAAEAVRAVLRTGVLDLKGLHVHIGSQILNFRAFETAATRALEFRAKVAAEFGTELSELNLGGGFGIPYTDSDPNSDFPGLAKRLRTIVAAECERYAVSRPRLAIEPGRAIAGPPGCTLYRVGTIKEVRGVRTYVSVDGGMSDNIRPALLGARYSVTLANRASTADLMLTRVVGRHCDAGDIVVRDCHLPSDLKAGDLLAVPVTGAYCRSWANNFNHTPRPPVIMLAEGQARVIVRRETVADLLRLDVG